MKKNIHHATLPDVGTAPAPLPEFHQAIVGKALDALAWYEAGQRSKKRWARLIRVMSILLGALATMVPTLAALVEHPSLGGQPMTIPLAPFATLLGVAAATLVILDQLFGLTSGWLRYMTTYQTIESRLDAFRIAWARELIRSAASTQPESDRVLAALDLLAAFSSDLDGAIRDETQAWVGEFKSALANLDRKVEGQRAAAATMATAAIALRGSVRVIVTNAADLDEHKWVVQYGDRASTSEHVGGKTAVLSPVDAGPCRVRVTGMKASARVAAEDVVEVRAAEVAEIKLLLE